MTESEFLKRINQDEPVMRSCWKCNEAHDYLKKADYIIWCIECDKLYFKGKELKITKNKKPYKHFRRWK